MIEQTAASGKLGRAALDPMPDILLYRRPRTMRDVIAGVVRPTEL